MKRRFPLAAAFAVLATTAAAQPPAPGDDLLVRMAAVNSGLHAFSAKMRAHVALESFPFLSADLTGTYYYKQPDKTKVVFTGGVPLVAAQFDKLYAHIESPSRWRSIYTVTLASDDGRTALFTLVPRKQGNVQRIDATVDDKSATVTRMRWNYENGGYAELNDRYGSVGGYLVVQSQSGHVQEPGYVANITSVLDGYTMNPNLSDDLFEQK